MGRLIKAAIPAVGEDISEAERIVAAAQSEAEAIVQSAAESGLAAGRADASDLAQAVDQRRQDLHEETDRRLQTGIRELVENSLSELLANDELFLKLVRNALRSQRRGREIFLRVHPDRAPFLQENRAALIAVLGRARSIEIREDITLGRDGCVVETDAGVLDVGLGTQLSVLFDGAAP